MNHENYDDMPDQERIGDRIRSVRKYLRITREEYASSLRISNGDLMDLEKDAAIPSYPLLELISVKYGVSYKWLLNGTGQMFDTDGGYQKYASLRSLSPKRVVKVKMALGRIQKEMEYIDRLLPDYVPKSQITERNKDKTV